MYLHKLGQGTLGGTERKGIKQIVLCTLNFLINTSFIVDFTVQVKYSPSHGKRIESPPQLNLPVYSVKYFPFYMNPQEKFEI